MKVGVLGSGDVGRALSVGFLSLGHEVMMGSRSAPNPKVEAFVKEAGDRARGGTFADAAAFGEIIVLATLGTASEEAIRLAGPDRLAGKVVMDTTNPLDFSRGFPPTLAVGHTDSLGERIQRAAPAARVVKVFNTVGHAHMVNPAFPGGPPDMFLCGDDDAARETVGAICRSFGWGVIDLGGMVGARYLEPMCLTWVLHGARRGSWSHAFKMLEA